MIGLFYSENSWSPRHSYSFPKRKILLLLELEPRPLSNSGAVKYYFVVFCFRSEKVRWRLVLQHCLELVWTGVMISYCMARAHAPAISGFRSVWLDGGAAISTFVGTLVPTTLILLAGFFGYFHSYCNLQAELTGFQDRMFYKVRQKIDLGKIAIVRFGPRRKIFCFLLTYYFSFQRHKLVQ